MSFAGRAIRVGLSALTSFGKVRRLTDDSVEVVFRLPQGRKSCLSAEQREILHRGIAQDRIPDRLRIEAGGRQLLSCGLWLEPCVGEVADQPNARHRHCAGADRRGASADESRLPVHIDDHAARGLQIALMRVEIGAGMERRQQHGIRLRLLSLGRDHCLTSQGNRWVRSAGKTQDSRQINWIFGTQRRNCRREIALCFVMMRRLDRWLGHAAVGRPPPARIQSRRHADRRNDIPPPRSVPARRHADALRDGGGR